MWFGLLLRFVYLGFECFGIVLNVGVLVCGLDGFAIELIYLMGVVFDWWFVCLGFNCLIVA